MVQFCPLCKKDVPFIDRFPYYLCGDCKSLLTDREGKSIEFYFAANPFGYKGHYKNDPGRAYLYDLCYIGQEEFRVFSDGKNECFIQPVNFSKYATRVGKMLDLPTDPSLNLTSRKFQPRKKRKFRIVYDLIFSVIPLVLFFVFSFLIDKQLLSDIVAFCFFFLINFLTIIFAIKLKFIKLDFLKKILYDFPFFLLVFLIFLFLGLMGFWLR